MDTQHSEDLFPDSEITDKDEKSPNQIEKEENTVTNPILGDDQETPDLFSEKVPETETFEEPLRLPESIDETPDLLENEDETPDLLEHEEETPDLLDEEMEDDLEEGVPEEDDAEMDLDEEEDDSVVKPLELKQADFESGSKKVKSSSEKESQGLKLINLPLGRVKNIMKLDPDVRLMSSESIFVIAKATELFIESLTKECMVHKDPKKKTIQKRDVDQVFASTDSLMFLEGAMDF